MATIASHKLLFTYYQKDGIDNTTYHCEFMAHVETIETYGGIGAIGIAPTFVTQQLKAMYDGGTCANFNKPTEIELAAAKKSVREEFLAGLMLSGANRDRYNALCNELANQIGFGNDLYPKTVEQCLTMLNCCKDATVPQPHNVTQQQAQEGTAPPTQEDEALVFAQGTDSRCSPVKSSSDPSPSKTTTKGSISSSSSSSVRGMPKITKIFCKNCGKMGHISSVCPDTKIPPAQIHAITTGHDDASESSKEESVIILIQVDEALLTQKASTSTSPCPINSDLLLMDSQSTVHLFSGLEHVSDIHPAATPICVHCNKGTLDTTNEADFGDTPVYFDSRGIANVLSLYRLGQKFRVTYDSEDCGGVFQVWTDKGVVKFAPTSKGLHTLNLKENPGAAYLLVNDADVAYQDSPVATVWANYEGFTKCQIKQANKARRLMSMICAPTERKFSGSGTSQSLKNLSYH